MTATAKNVCLPSNFRPRKKLGTTTALMIQPCSFSWENTYIWIHILSSTEINSHLVFFLDRQQQQHQLLLLLLIIHLPSIANKQNKHHVCFVCQSRCRVTRSNLRPKVRIRSCCSKDRSSISHDVNAFPLLPRDTNGLASATDAFIQLSKINTHTTIITSSSSSRKLLVENKAIEKFHYKTQQEACSKQSKTFSIKYVYGLCKKRWN
jgi:hypothetical protein